MKRKSAIVYASIFIGCLSVTAANAAGVFSYSGGTAFTGPLANNATIGYGFSVTDIGGVDITDLGWLNISGNPAGLTANHDVAIWDSNGVMWGSISVPISGGYLEDGFQYVSLGSFHLDTGDYVIGGTSASDVDPYVAFAVPINNDGRVSYGGFPLVNYSGPLAFPNIPTSGTAGFFGPNFKVAPVPVPAAVWLFGSGLLGLFGIARKRNAA
jgi:hypothetical protein